nr:hypothetical protein [uncultured Methanolobus sp.]
MKRLTISMSDELFDKLDVIENKSLFIRKLIERELDAVDNFSSEEVIPWSEGFSILKKDVNTIFSRLEEMESKLAGVNPEHGNEPLMQDSFVPAEQEILEEIPAPQDNLTKDTFAQNAFSHESVSPDEQMPIESIGIPDITEGTGAALPDIPAPIEADNSIIKEDILETATNDIEIEAANNEYQGIIETQIPEPTINTDIQKDDGTVQSAQTIAQEPTLMDTAPPEELIIPESPALDNSNEVTFRPPMPATEMPDAANGETPHEHKLSELVAEKIHKEIEEENDISSELEIPSFVPEQSKPETETQQAEFQMPEFKTLEQEIEQTDFQMPELKPPEQEMGQTEFQMPELKPPEQEMGQMEFQMPELKMPEQEMQQTEFQMPELKMPEQEIQQTDFQMPEFKPPEQDTAQMEFQMPELKLPEQEIQQTEFQMPEFKPPEQDTAQMEFQMPELKLPEQEMGQAEFQMPELKLPEQEMEQAEFQMPEFKPPEQEMGQTAFAMPELQTPETAPVPATNEPGFAMPDMKAPGMPPAAGETMPPFNAGTEVMPEMQSPVPQMQPSSSQSNSNQTTGAKPDKLETNILMYMPRGAKVKKEIIKSLVSRQFSQEDIEKKIQELVARQILILNQENGVEQLHRLK